MATRNFNANFVEGELLDEAIADLRSELGVTSRFPNDAWAEAHEAATSVDFSQYPDRRDIPFITIDPEGSRDLDQALHIEREGEGYLVRYAISAVALFVKPGGPLDEEVRRRGVTVYLPDRSIPLHPAALSTDAASLLPDVDRPAYVWYHHLDAQGELRHSWVELSQVRSRAQLTYEQVQKAVDDGAALPENVPADMVVLLKEVGKKRAAIEVARGGVSLELPEQRIEKTDGGYELSFRDLTAVEEWNSQLSLLTGIAAAKMMIDANIGILRTLPPALTRDVNKLRRAANSLGLNWPKSQSYPEFMQSLSDKNSPAIHAFMLEAVSLFRGANYLALPVSANDDGKPVNLEHAAMATPYAHVTAPLRRLVDRFGLEVCRCICSGENVPDWVREALPQLPKIMGRTTQATNKVESRAVAAAEALVLDGHQGEVYEGTIIELLGPDKFGNSRGVVFMREPAIEAVVTGEGLEVASEVRVRLSHVNIAKGQVAFTLVK